MVNHIDDMTKRISDMDNLIESKMIDIHFEFLRDRRRFALKFDGV